MGAQAGGEEDGRSALTWDLPLFPCVKVLNLISRLCCPFLIPSCSYPAHPLPLYHPTPPALQTPRRFGEQRKASLFRGQSSARRGSVDFVCPIIRLWSKQLSNRLFFLFLYSGVLAWCIQVSLTSESQPPFSYDVYDCAAVICYFSSVGFCLLFDCSPRWMNCFIEVTTHFNGFSDTLFCSLVNGEKTRIWMREVIPYCLICTFIKHKSWKTIHPVVLCPSACHRDIFYIQIHSWHTIILSVQCIFCNLCAVLHEAVGLRAEAVRRKRPTNICKKKEIDTVTTIFASVIVIFRKQHYFGRK